LLDSKVKLNDNHVQLASISESIKLTEDDELQESIIDESPYYSNKIDSIYPAPNKKWSINKLATKLLNIVEYVMTNDMFLKTLAEYSKNRGKELTIEPSPYSPLFQRPVPGQVQVTPAEKGKTVKTPMLSLGYDKDSQAVAIYQPERIDNTCK
jgi:hypothetical protein